MKASMDTIVDEIWERVHEKSPDLLNDWIQCFSSSYREGKDKSKEEIKLTSTRRDYQTDPGKNFLCRLMSKEPQEYGYKDRKGEQKRRVELAMIFLQVMMENSYFEKLIVPNIDTKHPDTNHTINFLNLKLALNGAAVTEDNWDEATTDTATPLHNAARFENVREVSRLLREGEKMKINPHGYTPLHFAAMAIHPKPEIAKMLIGSVNGKRLLNKQTNREYGRNTALHIAASNVNVTKEFIQQFKDAASLRLNSKNDTPFHMAAESKNSSTIIHMLNTFAPTNNRWDVDRVDEGEDEGRSKGQGKTENTLIKICARRGNSAAVALLIKHGADIAEGVLHEIVIESVRNPRKIDKLVLVYYSVVDNAVTWRNLEEDHFLIVKGSDEYAERFRKTMIWLLTTPNENYGREDVLQCALTHGASSMFWRIINTKSVFRFDGKETCRFVEEKNENANGVDNVDGDTEKNWTVFDVTNFTTETLLEEPNPSDFDSSHRQGENGQHNMSGESILSGTEDDRETLSESIALCPRPSNAGSRPKHEPIEPAATNNVEKRRDFDTIHVPEKPYLICLLSAFDQWKSSNVLSTQPLNKLTKPYVTFVQRFYFLLGLLQLAFMILFTVYWMPTTCSLAMMFNVFTTGCSSSRPTRNNSDDAMLPSFSHQRSWIAMLWLIWPIILLSENVALTYLYVKQSYTAHISISKKKILKSKELDNLEFRWKLKTPLLKTLGLRVFCLMTFAWLCVYFWTESHETYVQVTSLVFLFGWITNLSFFGAVSKNVSISTLVVEEIIIKDISSFMLFFGFTVVGFSFAMHTIRMSACMPNQIIYLHDTFFAVLSSAFGIGDFFDATVTDPACKASDSTENLFEFVYLGYVFATMIVLLNILIAMINNRYEKAKRKAENIWRYETLCTMRALKTIIKSINCFVYNCRNGNGNHQETSHSKSVTKKFNRYYLRLLLPVDERLKKLK